MSRKEQIKLLAEVEQIAARHGTGNGYAVDETAAEAQRIAIGKVYGACEECHEEPMSVFHQGRRVCADCYIRLSHD